MNFKIFAQKYANEIGGEFRDYDDNQSVIVIRLKNGRFQAVQGNVYPNEQYDGREVVELKTKVCTVEEPFDVVEVLTESASHVYSKFIIEDGFLKVKSAAFMDSVNDARIKEMFQEIGAFADKWELKITGKDIY